MIRKRLPALPGAAATRWSEVSDTGTGRFGVVGLGRMAQALLFPLIEAGLIESGDVRAAVASEASARRIAAEHGLSVGTDPAPAWACPVVLLAIKPQQLEAAAIAAPPPLLPSSGDGSVPLLISVLAGVNLDRLQRLFPGRRIVRAVPNTPALVRAGLTALAFDGGVDADQRQWVRSLFALVGEVLELPEVQLDAFLALASSGPAFVALIAEAMADGAVAAGLPRALAQHLAHRTLAGTAALLHQRELHPGQLKDMVASPGGTTVAGLRRLEAAGVRSALLEAVLAAAERSRELA
jgi:pyrroline-5-carboxylate reductase